MSKELMGVHTNAPRKVKYVLSCVSTVDPSGARLSPFMTSNFDPESGRRSSVLIRASLLRPLRWTLPTVRFCGALRISSRSFSRYLISMFAR